jgi:hypothetical protein
LNAFNVTVPAYAALRTSRYLYVQYDYGARQLFDVLRDPAETHDIISSAKASLVRDLTSRLHGLEACRAASCRRRENAPLTG